MLAKMAKISADEYFLCVGYGQQVSPNFFRKNCCENCC